MDFTKISAHAIARDHPDYEKIVFDPINGQISIVGRTLTFRVPFSSVYLEKYKSTDGGMLSVDSAGICLNLDLSIDEYVQTFYCLAEVRKLRRNGI